MMFMSMMCKCLVQIAGTDVKAGIDLPTARKVRLCRFCQQVRTRSKFFLVARRRIAKFLFFCHTSIQLANGLGRMCSFPVNLFVADVSLGKQPPGCSVTWLARLHGVQKVAGSNPVTPTPLDRKPFDENVEGLSHFVA